MTLSIIVPFYCRPSSQEAEQQCILRLKRCLDSLCHSKRAEDYEIVLVNDDDEETFYQRLQQHLQSYNDKPLRVLQQPHRGAAAARNKGIHEARGTWLWMVDADDYVVSHSIDLLLDLLQTVPDTVDLVKLGDMIKDEKTFFAAEQRLQTNTFATSPQPPLALLRPRSSGLDHTTYLYRRTFLQQQGNSYPEEMTLNEDSFFVLSCLLAATQAYSYPTLQLYHLAPQRQSVTAGRWNEEQSRRFIQDSILFFTFFKGVCGESIIGPFSPSSNTPSEAIMEQMRTTYDRYLYVYCRVLAVKGCPWKEIAEFRFHAGVKNTFYFLPKEANFKAHCLAVPFINRLLNLFSRLVRH